MKPKTIARKISELSFIVCSVITIIKFVTICPALINQNDVWKHIEEFVIFMVASFVLWQWVNFLDLSANGYRPKWIVYLEALEKTQAELMDIKNQFAQKEIRIKFLSEANHRLNTQLREEQGKSEEHLKMILSECCRIADERDSACARVEQLEKEINIRRSEILTSEDSRQDARRELLKSLETIKQLEAQIDQLKITRAKLVEVS